MQTSFNSSSLLPLRKVVELTGLHANTLRRYADSGELPTVTLPSGHRRWKKQDVLEWLGLDGEKERDEGQRIIIYARVSGSNQASGFRSKGSLDNDLGRQLKNLRSFVKKNYKNCKVEEYTDVGSGISMTRPKFQRMLSKILSGQYDHSLLVCSFRDRVCRFGFELVAQICSAHNITITYSSDDPDQLSDDESLAGTILDFIHVFSCKRYSKRSAANRRKQIPQEKLQEGIQLLKAGWSIRSIAEKFGRDGVTDQHGQKIKFTTLRNHLIKQRAMIELVTDSVPENSFERFYKAKIRKCSKEAEISWSKIVSKYENWCAKNNETKVTKRAVKKHLNVMGIKHFVLKKHGISELRFRGISILR